MGVRHSTGTCMNQAMAVGIEIDHKLSSISIVSTCILWMEYRVIEYDSHWILLSEMIITNRIPGHDVGF